MKTIVHVEGLHKTYGKTVAVEDISFDVQEGEIFGMVGPNGAGKTTTIECLEGLRKPDVGKIQVLGVDPQVDGHFLRERTGMQLQQSNLPDRMKVWEALDLYASFYPKSVNWKNLLDALGLMEKYNTPFSKLSGGQKQRLFIALALLPDPQLIFLDELTTGLDPQARHAIWELIRDVRSRGKTILLTTHFMEEAERLCDRVVIIDHGRVVALNTPAALIQSLNEKEKVIFELFDSLTPTQRNALMKAGRCDIQGGLVTIHAKLKSTAPLLGEIVNVLDGNGIHCRNLRSEQPDLEDVFLSLTGREMRE